MAIAAGHDGVDEIVAALDRGFRGRAAGHSQQQDRAQRAGKNAGSQHDSPHFRKLYVMASRASATPAGVNAAPGWLTGM